MLQWYENTPAVCSATENRPPGSSVPEFHPVVSDVDVWATASVFVHVTVVPTATFRASGANARSPSVEAPAGIVTDVDGPSGVSAGDGIGEDDGEDDE